MRRPTLLDEIRAALDSAPAHPASRAVLAVLAEHGNANGHCETCAGEEQYDCYDMPLGVSKVPYPCRTIQAIADELGVTGARIAADTLVIFVDDLRAAGHPPLTTVRRLDRDSGPDGPYGFDVVFEGAAVAVAVPGLPVEKMRLTPGGDGHVTDFERLHVNGSSWLWPFALDMCAMHGSGVGADD